VEKGRGEEAQTLLERAIVTLGRGTSKNARGVGLAWEGLAAIADDAGRKKEAHQQSAVFFRTAWRRDRHNTESLGRAVKALVAAGEREAARTLLREETRVAADARSRRQVREMLLQLEETKE